MSEKCFAAGCGNFPMRGSVLCREHYNNLLPAPMKGAQDPEEAPVTLSAIRAVVREELANFLAAAEKSVAVLANQAIYGKCVTCNGASIDGWCPTCNG
jgi:hypothetical protein